MASLMEDPALMGPIETKPGPGLVWTRGSALGQQAQFPVRRSSLRRRWGAGRAVIPAHLPYALA